MLGGNLGNGLANVLLHVVFQGALGQIAVCNHPHQPLVLIENNQPGNLVRAHVLGASTERIVGKAVQNFFCHDFSHFRVFRIFALGHQAHNNIAIGNKPLQPFGITDQK